MAGLHIRSAFALALSGCVLVSCTDKGVAAEKRYEMVQRTGTHGEICDAGKAVAAAYFEAGNEEKYKWWHMMSNSACLTARLEGYGNKPGATVVIDNAFGDGP